MTGYPLLNLFWTMLLFFLWIIWFVLLFPIFADIFTSEDLRGLGKAGWTAFVVLVPYLGVFVYLIARGGRMHRRAAAPASAADELAKLAELRDRGVITDDEFTARKSLLSV